MKHRCIIKTYDEVYHVNTFETKTSAYLPDFRYSRHNLPQSNTYQRPILLLNICTANGIDATKNDAAHECFCDTTRSQGFGNAYQQ